PGYKASGRYSGRAAQTASRGRGKAHHLQTTRPAYGRVDGESEVSGSADRAVLQLLAFFPLPEIADPHSAVAFDSGLLSSFAHQHLVSCEPSNHRIRTFHARRELNPELTGMSRRVAKDVRGPR